MMIMYCESISICLYLLFIAVKSYPAYSRDLDTKLDYNDEKRYPNGTVIGKYTYKDREGNPIQVKYFADDSSYGVELKSVKVFDANSENDLLQYKLPNNENIISTSDMFQPLEDMTTTNAIMSKGLNKNKTYDPIEVLNSYPKKLNRYKDSHKTNNDYEIFLENDLKSAEKINNEKVKVYFDKNKRKTRNAPYLYKPSNYCKLF